eukprot:SAG11_NODE_4912_length_1725_cov_0.937269_2_plen_165_part_00
MLYEKEEYELSIQKFEEAGTVDPENPDWQEWLKKAKYALAHVVIEPPKVIEVKPDEVIVKGSVKAKEFAKAATKTAEKAFKDLDLGSAGTLNYMKFINWFKKQMKLQQKRRISDHTLQTTMKIWKQFDKDGMGVRANALGGVMTGMITAGVVRISSDGTVIDCN